MGTVSQNVPFFYPFSFILEHLHTFSIIRFCGHSQFPPIFRYFFPFSPIFLEELLWEKKTGE